jgi:hypothetical protein
MANGGVPVEQLRDYLQELKPEARSMLLAELERGLVRGDAVPGAELIVQELRRAAVGNDETLPTHDSEAARLFFKPFDPFLVDAAADHKHRARIARVALVPIWNWIGRELLPAEVKTYGQEVERALAAKDTAKADALARSFQDLAAQRMQQVLAATQNDEKGRRKLTAQVGTPRAADDVMTLCGVLTARDALATLGARLPIQIRNLADDQLGAVKALLDPYAARSGDMFVYTLLLVMSRLAASWQLVRLATFCAVSDEAARVAESRYAPAVTIVLAEVERLAGELKTELKSGRASAALLKTIHDALRGLRTELDIPADSPWGRQLAAIQTEISGRLKAVVDSMPARVRRLLRPRTAKDTAPGAVLDSMEVAETETLIEFVAACKAYAGELAINEITLRTYSELQVYLESRTPALVEGLRIGGDEERAIRRSQVDAAVRFCAQVFGQEYAATLAKSAEVAANSERKAAKVS